MYKYSIDNQTIRRAETIQDIVNILKEEVKGYKGLIQSTFTIFDIKSGDTIRVPYNATKRGYIWIGKRLTKEHLISKVDGWGRIIKEQ